jgi:hypothetical protein
VSQYFVKRYAKNIIAPKPAKIRSREGQMKKWWVAGAILVGLFWIIAQALAAAQKPLPLIPKMVAELYLPEEQAACRSLYGFYTGLAAEDLTKLEQGGEVAVQMPRLSAGYRERLANWFNRARWGCDAPAERLTPDSVSEATGVLTGKDGVITFSLQSPKQKLWKTLTIACSPDKAQWVRDGLPLVPSWFQVPWQGGPLPPPVEVLSRSDPRTESGWGYKFPYMTLRDTYSFYAGLPADSLRKLHSGRAISFKFQDLPLADRQRLADAIDQEVMRTNISWGSPLELGRPPELRKMFFGITTVWLVATSFDAGCLYAWPQGNEGITALPSPYRAVFLHLNPLGSKDIRPGVTTNPPLASFNQHGDIAYLIAWPTEIQQSVLRYRKEWFAWESKWVGPVAPGSQVYGRRPGSPPPPTSKPFTYLAKQK